VTLTLSTVTSASSYGTPGPAQITPASNQGDTLLVLAGWDVAAPSGQVAGGSPIVPCAAVVDSQGNRWRLIADSGSQVAGARCAAWLCTNALALGTDDWLSVCPQGNYTSLFTMCAVFTGAPASYWPVIDFTQATNSQSSSSLSLTQTTGQADYCFGVAATGDTLVTISGAGAGWTSIGTGSVGGANPDGLQISADYRAVNASTSVTATYTLSGARPMAMCMVGVSQASFLPVQQKSDFPLIVTEAAFGATIGDPSQALLDNQWTDISQYAIGPDGSAIITASRGRQYELDQPESGTLSITCNNQAGVFNPQNAGSPFYSDAINSNMSFQSGVSPWTGQNSATVQSSSVASFASTESAVVTQSMLMSPPASASAAPVVRASGNSAGGVTSFGVTVASTITGGHLIVGVGTSNTGAILGISDSKGNVYTLVTQVAQPQPMSVFDAPITVTLTTADTITVTATVSTVINVIAVHETSVSAVVLPMTAQGLSSTASCTTGYLTGLPAQVLAFESNNTSSPTWSSPMTSLSTQSGGGGPFFTAAYQTVTSAGSLRNFSPTATFSGTHTWSMAIVQLLPSLSGSGTFGAASEQAAVTPVTPYSASAWIMAPAGISSAAQVAITWYTSGHASISTTTSSSQSALAQTWTQVSLLNATPPSNAAFAQVIVQVTGSYAGVVYIAEAGMSPGANAVQAGLVRLGTPIRVTAFWNGRNYPVAWGLVERWPQSWPNFPQWGWSNLIATDIAGAASVTIPSALQGQILLDQPYASFPLSEQYSSSANTINGVVKTTSECDGQVATNIVISNQRPAVYADGNHAVETGLSMGFLGDNGTGIGVTSYNTFDLSGDRGPGVQYGPDLTLPPIASGGTGNLTFEVWTTVPDNVTLPGSTVTVQLWEIMVEPDLESNGANNLAQGVLVTGGIYYSTTTIQAYWQPNWLAATIITAGTLVPGELCQLGFVFENGNFRTILNGAVSGAIAGAPTSVPLYALAFGLSTSVTGSRGTFDGNYNYSIAYPTLYPYRLSTTQVVEHWNAGTTGFSGDTVLQRAARYVAWSQVNVGLAGPVITETPLLGPAYDSAGNQMNAALQSDSVSAGSRWGGVASGSLVVLPRTTLYNRPVNVTFGDAPLGILNFNALFSAGTTGWATANGATGLAIVTSPGGFGYRAITFHGNGSTASAQLIAAASASSTHVSVTALSSYIAGTWIQAGTTWASGITMQVDWYTSGNVFISTSAGNNSGSLSSGTWTYVEVVASAPATAANAVVYIQVSGTPASSIIFSVTQFFFILMTDQVPYQPTMSLDYDNSYVSNSASATLTNGPNTLASPLVVDPASVVKYLQRGPLAQQVSGQTTEDAYDRATWSLGKFSEPSMRVSGMSVDVAAYPLAFSQTLKTDIGDVGAVVRTPIGNQGYNLPVVIEQVDIEISADRWVTSYQHSPNTPENAVLYVDDSSTSDSTLGTGTLPW
jgi:hypothetical protein